MSEPSYPRQPEAAGDRLTQREDLLELGLLEPPVRHLIGESWLRSRRAGVDPTDVQAPYADADPTDLTPLVQAVMTRMSAELSGEPISMIFADARGRVVHRMCADASLSRRLERVSLAPGFTYAEDTVGTNGIGTALQLAAPTLVVGDEHFSEPLRSFACAGAPVHHPVTGVLLGVLDLTCEAGVSNSLLLTYARTLAARIQDEVLTHSSSREMSLVRDYLAACRHATVPILALSDDLVMMNRLAQQRLDGADRTALIARTSDAFGSQEPRTFVADLPSGASARLDYRPSLVGEAVIGGVFRVQISQSSASPATSSRHRPEAVALPGLAGRSPQWVRAVGHLREAHRLGTWTIVQGEPGVGKHALVRAVHLGATPRRHLRTLDAAVAAEDPDDWYEQLEDEFRLDEGTLVLRHLDRLPDLLVEPLATLLVEQAARERSSRRWVVATYDVGTRHDHTQASVIPSFDRTIVLDPLRHRPEDVRVLIPALLRAVAPANRDLGISPAALGQLARHPWPGNAAQLRDVLRRIVAVKRSGTIELADLPPECMSVGRRNLSPLEALERDAITRALHDYQGNKALAAEHLGMSRATIYRKIRGYNIITSNSG
ncbi:MAG TPA: helix-turn-helix domain-containing protein [Intrasporangium sp.]|uniref:sigma-54-dependent Fis family transcriptional regulator n=1 Tax=Intrasporangium sp. TaxID=1925024 RepID=UPI002D774748|nr:helix-turn-helix domain-containing protein [Intrasporangium sp.]HET7398503.1 helix-turn-helix domain-containing protein [Intrasporangium sp.]